jgi:hypothetical protein
MLGNEPPFPPVDDTDIYEYENQGSGEMLMDDATEDPMIKTNSALKETSQIGDWNLLAPSLETILNMNKDATVDISSEKIFASIKESNQRALKKSQADYDRTVR